MPGTAGWPDEIETVDRIAHGVSNSEAIAAIPRLRLDIDACNVESRHL